MNIFERDLEAIKTFPRQSLVRIARHTTDEQLYEAVRHELFQRDTGRLVNYYVEAFTGSDRISGGQEV